jgi:hypothetical protein
MLMMAHLLPRLDSAGLSHVTLDGKVLQRIRGGLEARQSGGPPIVGHRLDLDEDDSVGKDCQIDEVLAINGRLVQPLDLRTFEPVDGSA